MPVWITSCRWQREPVGWRCSLGVTEDTVSWISTMGHTARLSTEPSSNGSKSISITAQRKRPVGINRI